MTEKAVINYDFDLVNHQWYSEDINYIKSVYGRHFLNYVTPLLEANSCVARGKQQKFWSQKQTKIADTIEWIEEKPASLWEKQKIFTNTGHSGIIGKDA